MEVTLLEDSKKYFLPINIKNKAYINFSKNIILKKIEYVYICTTQFNKT